MTSRGEGMPSNEQPWEESSTHRAEGEVERRLAHFAFVREERDGEVRLQFRDVPTQEIALSFRAAGAALLSLSGERALAGEQNTAPEPPRPVEYTPEGEPAEPKPRKQPRRPPRQVPTGELTLRYFYTLQNTIYTVAIALPSGVAGSVAPIYPVARLSERQLRERLGVVFT